MGIVVFDGCCVCVCVCVRDLSSTSFPILPLLLLRFLLLLLRLKLLHDRFGRSLDTANGIDENEFMAPAAVVEGLTWKSGKRRESCRLCELDQYPSHNPS